MAAHVRNDRDVLSALEWLGQTDPGQISSVSKALLAQMRSSLIASIGALLPLMSQGPLLLLLLNLGLHRVHCIQVLLKLNLDQAWKSPS